ncbi:MAG: transporter associated domain-containing protein, partial [Rhodothermales bacterium]|nr:transporter associated domain-containing protein [Rhodothermales bacterium]
GEIRDEYDEGEESMYEKIGRNAYRCDARIDLDDLFEVLGSELETEEFDFETLGGLILNLSGSIPTAGDVLTYKGLRITVREVDNRRIRTADVVLESHEAPSPGRNT